MLLAGSIPATLLLSRLFHCVKASVMTGLKPAEMILHVFITGWWTGNGMKMEKTTVRINVSHTVRCMQMEPTCVRICGGNHSRWANPPAFACKWTRRTWWQSSISSLKAQRKAPVSAAVRSMPAKRNSWSLRKYTERKGKRQDECWWMHVSRREIIVEAGLRASCQPALSLTSENIINQWLVILILLWFFCLCITKLPGKLAQV